MFVCLIDFKRWLKTNQKHLWNKNSQKDKLTLTGVTK